MIGNTYGKPVDLFNWCWIWVDRSQVDVQPLNTKHTSQTLHVISPLRSKVHNIIWSLSQLKHGAKAFKQLFLVPLGQKWPEETEATKLIVYQKSLSTDYYKLHALHCLFDAIVQQQSKDKKIL